MLTLDEAFSRIIETVRPLVATRLPLVECRGLTLAEDVISTVDSPPFDKSLMDGYAVLAADVASGNAALRVIEQIMAGQTASRAVTAGTAVQIMTGAPLPVGADAVVRIEDTRHEGDTVHIAGRPVVAEQNLIRRGVALRIGEQVLQAGDTLSASRIGALAELGCSQPAVRRRPSVAVLATGDELVPVDVTPGPGQIRNSNEPMLAAQLEHAGALPRPLGVARDNRPDLAAKIRAGLACDLLVLSGGVSAGKLDLVPSELAAAGVREVFHKVDMKPGKPLWFGVLDGPAGQPACYVFGLPGNPVSSMVCCELFVRTAIRRLMGVSPAIPQPLAARFVGDYAMRGDRPTYHPAQVTATATGWEARLVTWQGSSDLHATVDANGMVFLPAVERTYRTGDPIDAYLWT